MSVYKSLYTTTPVFKVSDPAPHKPGCKISDSGSRGIVISIYVAKMKAADLCLCFVYQCENQFSHDAVQDPLYTITADYLAIQNQKRCLFFDLLAFLSTLFYLC